MSDGSKGGTRPPEYIRALALARVEDLMIQGYGPQSIFAKLCDEGFTDSEDTARAWRQAVQKRWAIEEAEERPARKEGWRHRILTRIRRLETKALTATGLAAAALESEITKLFKLGILVDGAHAPVVHKIEHSSVPVEAMSPIERERELAELLKRREAALAVAKRREPGLLS